MGDSQNIPDPHDPPKESVDPGAGNEPIPPTKIHAELSSDLPFERAAAPPSAIVAQQDSSAIPVQVGRTSVAARHEDAALRRRSFRRNLFALLGLALAAFILASWILVRVDAPFGIFPSGPQEIVRAQLRALDRGELRPAYDMFSARYRDQVSFDTWHELFITHWRMFHADVLRAEPPSQTGPGVTLEIYLHGADDKDYRARFTLIRTDGRWWIDDVHWTQEADERDVSRT